MSRRSRAEPRRSQAGAPPEGHTGRPGRERALRARAIHGPGPRLYWNSCSTSACRSSWSSPSWRCSSWDPNACRKSCAAPGSSTARGGRCSPSTPPRPSACSTKACARSRTSPTPSTPPGRAPPPAPPTSLRPRLRQLPPPLQPPSSAADAGPWAQWTGSREAGAEIEPLAARPAPSPFALQRQAPPPDAVPGGYASTSSQPPLAPAPPEADAPPFDPLADDLPELDVPPIPALPPLPDATPLPVSQMEPARDGASADGQPRRNRSIGPAIHSQRRHRTPRRTIDGNRVGPPIRCGSRR